MDKRTKKYKDLKLSLYYTQLGNAAWESQKKDLNKDEKQLVKRGQNENTSSKNST